jgi:hypothetical protein
MAKAKKGERGRPRVDPGDPQLKVNPHRVRAALLFSRRSQREVVAEARKRKLAPLTIKGLHNLGAGAQRTSRRSRLEALAEVTGVSVGYLTEQAPGEDFLGVLAHAFAVSNWDIYPGAGADVFKEIKKVAADARTLLDLDEWQRRCRQGGGKPSQQERDDFAVELLGVLRVAFGRHRRRDALRSLRAWLAEKPTD